MVNHVRTWLANMTPFRGELDGDEYIAPDFVPVPESLMSSTLRRARRALFGVNPSRDAVNARLAAFMAVLHYSSLADKVEEADPRISYEIDGSAVLGSNISGTDLDFNLPDILVKLEFLNDPATTFFNASPEESTLWYETGDQFEKLAAALLTTAVKTERAAQGRE